MARWASEEWVHHLVKELRPSLLSLSPLCMVELYDLAMKHKCASLLLYFQTLEAILVGEGTRGAENLH